MKVHKISEGKLPEHNQYVLAYFPDSPWIDDSCVNEEHKWVVVKFVRGRTLKDRETMPFETPIRGQDEYGNNKKPYYWDAFGPGSFFGQEASVWCTLPYPLQMTERRMVEVNEALKDDPNPENWCQASGGCGCMGCINHTAFKHGITKEEWRQWVRVCRPDIDEDLVKREQYWERRK